VEKAQLRKVGLQALKWLHSQPAIKQQKEMLILAAFFADELWQQAQTIGLIRSLSIEFSTAEIFQQAQIAGKQLAVPRSGTNKELLFHQVTPETNYELSSFGVEEPNEQAPLIEKTALDLLIVPGVIFTTSGYRIGFGGGYYDRYLTDFTGRTCSLVFSEQIQENWQPEIFDRQVEKIFFK